MFSLLCQSSWQCSCQAVCRQQGVHLLDGSAAGDCPGGPKGEGEEPTERVAELSGAHLDGLLEGSQLLSLGQGPFSSARACSSAQRATTPGFLAGVDESHETCGRHGGRTTGGADEPGRGLTDLGVRILGSESWRGDAWRWYCKAHRAWTSAHDIITVISRGFCHAMPSSSLIHKGLRAMGRSTSRAL